MSLSRPTTQAGHRAAVHPVLRRGLEVAIAETLRAEGVRVTYFSTRRPQLDCSTVSGPCSSRSDHSVLDAAGFVHAADMGGRAKADAEFWRRFASRIPGGCIEAGVSYGDNNHFEYAPGPGCSPAFEAGGTSSRTIALVALGAAVVLGLALS